jgi:hypothetical protein
MHKLSMIFIDYLDALVTRGGGGSETPVLCEYEWSTDGVQMEYKRSTSGVRRSTAKYSGVRVEYNTMK